MIYCFSCFLYHFLHYFDSISQDYAIMLLAHFSISNFYKFLYLISIELFQVWRHGTKDYDREANRVCVLVVRCTGHCPPGTGHCIKLLQVHIIHCTYLPFYLSICLFIYLSNFLKLSIYLLSIYLLSIYLFIYLPFYLSTLLSIYPFIYLPFYLSTLLSIYPFIYLPFYLSTLLSIYPFSMYITYFYPFNFCPVYWSLPSRYRSLYQTSPGIIYTYVPFLSIYIFIDLPFIYLHFYCLSI